MPVRNDAGRMPWWARLAAGLLVFAGLLVLVAKADLIPGLPNPFAETTKDRSGPAVLKSIKDMSRFEGASGNFQVIVDLQKDATFLPDAVRGRRTLYVGAGSVNAYVEFGKLGDNAVKVSDDRASATIKLPHANLERTSLDPKRSYVVAEQRGFFDRISDFFSSIPDGQQQQVQSLAADKIQAAAKDSGLGSRAEANTRAMLQQLLISLGFTKVSVTFS
ncbi:MAG: hypothetical protein QOF84_4984 [Streptomyces sp.]|jgi:hypothetical protein|nr:hypothetical protein [Streptomyces sp.]MDX6350194.1 hypothetical protein [Streptomyces sp.]